jgi:feruloyl esterase
MRHIEAAAGTWRRVNGHEDGMDCCRDDAPTGPGAPPSATTLPAYCRLDGVIDRRAELAGATYGIGFGLALPESWNGRFLLQGGGDLNGSVQTPIGGSAAGGTPGLARGFAVASTDTGHQGRGGFDASFMQDQ